MSLLKACESAGINRRMVYKQMWTDEKFREHINFLRAIQAEMLADELFDIADDGEIPDRLRYSMIDTRKWYLSKIVPRFKDKQEIEHKGSIESLNDDERTNRIVALLERARTRRDGQSPSEEGTA